MASSSFLQSSVANQHELLEQLVSKFLSGEASVAEKRKAVGVCQQRARFHSFLDTNPATVEAGLQDVLELLQIESRHRDRARLLRLKQLFLDVPLKSDVLDVQFSLLRFLLGLAGDITANPQTSEAVMEIDTEQEDGGVDMSSEAWSEDSCKSPSELSAWSEKEERDEANPWQMRQAGLRVEEPPNWHAYFVPSQESLPVPASEEQKPEGSLLHCLTKVQLPDVQLSACGLFLHSESDLVLGCLRVLQGRDSAVFQWNRLERCFHIDSRLQTLHFSAVAMRHALAWFGKCGCHTRCLLDWTGAMIDLSSRRNLGGSYGRPMPSQSVISPTLSAAAQAIHDQLNSLLRPVIQLEHQLESNKCENVSLIRLKCITAAVSNQIHVLYEVMCHLHKFQMSEKSPSVTTCEILDHLYDLVTADYLMGGSFYQTGNEIIWKVFLESLAPLLSQLTAWLYLGDLSSISEDFFISPKPARHTEESDFWLDAFVLKEGACPKFLSSVISSLHDGGKALQFMRSQEHGHQFENYGANRNIETGRLESLIRDHWTKNLLYQEFTAFLSASAEGAPAENLCKEMSSVAQRMAAAGEYDGQNALHLLQKSSVPWTYISEEDVTDLSIPVPPIPSLSTQRSESSRGKSPVPVIPDTETDEDRSDWPESYIKVLDAIERLQAEFEPPLAMPFSPKESALYLILPEATERQPYSKLRETIFKTASPVSDLPNADVQSSPQTRLRVHADPAEVLLREGLLDTLHTRSVEIVRAFIDCLLRDLGLMREIQILKNVFFLGSPAMSEWTRRFSDQLIEGHDLTGITEFEVLADMQECFLTCHAGEELPVCGDNEFEALFFDMRVAEFEAKFPDQKLWKERSPQEINNCSLVYPLKWPLCLVVNEPRLKRYNTVFLFLLKLQWVNFAVKHNGWRMKQLHGHISPKLLSPYGNLQNWRQLYKLSHEMTHFVKTLQQHVLQNIHSAFDDFCKGIVDAQSVSELLNQHDATLESIFRFAFQARKKQWRTVHTRLLTLFHAILNFCSLWKTMEATDRRDVKKLDLLLEGMDRVVGQYHEARSSVMMILQIYSFSLGGNRELNDLIALLNFNGIYQQYTP